MYRVSCKGAKDRCWVCSVIVFLMEVSDRLVFVKVT